MDFPKSWGRFKCRLAFLAYRAKPIIQDLKTIFRSKGSNSTFKGSLKITFSDDGRYATLEDILIFEWVHKQEEKFTILVEAGFVSDGASVPRAFWAYAPPFAGKYARAAIVHDYMLKTRPFDRVLCDKVFLYALLACGCSKMRTALMYGAVASYSLFNEYTETPFL